MSEARWQALSERYQRREAEMHAPLTDENMAACVEELVEVFRRRGITADCWLDSPTVNIRARVK